jgi:membrane protease YdiL (CAAX protease family)
MTDVAEDSVASADAQVVELQPFERWLEAARPKAALWRMVIGVIIILAIWTMWTAAVLFAYALSVALWGDLPSAQIAVEQLVNGSTPLAAMTLLLSFLGLWLGVWLAARLMHGQKFATIISPEGKVRRREFFLGVGIIAGYFAISLTLSYAAGLSMGRRSELSVIEWATLVVPVCVLVFFQASGEELLFRGYLTQQLGARFRHPLIWVLWRDPLFEWDVF